MKSVRCLRFKGFSRVPSAFLRLAGGISMLTAAAGAQPTPGAPTVSTLYNFNVIHSGDQPQAALTPGANGVYYGTTDVGGTTGNGTVFEFIPPVAGQSGWSQKVIHKFSGPPDGSTPSSGLLVGQGGVLYGVTGTGGAAGDGVVFMLTPPASGEGDWTETILYNFKGGSDGAAPYGTLVAGENGVLYGSTVAGGSANAGVVFSLTPPAAGKKKWTEAVLYTFQGNPDGVSPTNGLVRDDTGALYGMTSAGGTSGNGIVYRLVAPANGVGAWSETILYSFAGAPDGSFPNGGLVRDGNGILYGVTFGGGTAGWGAVFSLTPPPAGQSTWSENVLYSFSGGADGGSPDNTLVLGPDGRLYGTNNFNSNGYGTVFALTPPAQGQSVWSEATLINFDGTNGANPIGLVLNASGALIGTTYDGGSQEGNGGIVFKLTPAKEAASPWGYKILYRFPDTRNDGEYPNGALLREEDGTLFGGTASGGTHNHGAVFKLSPPLAGETAWHETLIHSFNGANGSQGSGPLLEGKDGTLYGVTTAGGPFGGAIGGYGTVYALTPAAGHQAWTEKILIAFTGVANSDGAFPEGGLIADASGNLYGTASSGGIATSEDQEGNGIVFKLSPSANGQGGWTATIIYRFTGPDGSTPQGSLLLGKNGELYGTTYVGGSAGEGTVFELRPPANPGGKWTETVLYSFDDRNGNDGAIPGAEQLVADASGALYGTTSQGGLYGDGTFFKLTPAGARTTWIETILHSFNGSDGAEPFVGLLAGTDGFYGVTPQGGAFNWGTIFKLTAPVSGIEWNASVVHSFNREYDRGGIGPNGALIQDSSGNLYGTTSAGGHGVGGVVFKLAAP